MTGDLKADEDQLRAGLVPAGLNSSALFEPSRANQLKSSFAPENSGMITLPKNCVTVWLRKRGFFVAEADDRYVLVPSLKDIHYQFYTLVRKRETRDLTVQKAVGTDHIQYGFLWELLICGANEERPGMYTLLVSWTSTAFWFTFVLLHPGQAMEVPFVAAVFRHGDLPLHAAHLLRRRARRR